MAKLQFAFNQSIRTYVTALHGRNDKRNARTHFDCHCLPCWSHAVHAKTHWSRATWTYIRIFDLIFVRLGFHGKCNSSIVEGIERKNGISRHLVGSTRGKQWRWELKKKIYCMWVWVCVCVRDAEWLMDDLSALPYTCFPTLCMSCHVKIFAVYSDSNMYLLHTLWLWPSNSILNCVTFRATHTAFAWRQIYYYVRYTCIRAHARPLHACVGTESDIGRKASNQIHSINLNSLWHHVAAEHRFFSAYACVS